LEFLREFADRRLLEALTIEQFPAGKLPKPSVPLAFWALAEQESAVHTNHSRDHGHTRR